jgi:two-component system NtrC family sensor kinase
LGILQAKKRIGIGIRLAFMVAALLILSTGFFVAFSLITQRREIINMFAHNTLNMTRSLERILRFSMLENRRGEIESAIKQIGAEEDIESISLVTHEGDIVYCDQPAGDKRVSIDDDRCSGCHSATGGRPLKRLPKDADFRIFDEEKSVEISLPVYNSETCYNAACHAHSETETVLGVMQMSVSYARMDDKLSKSHARLMALSVAMAIITSLLVLWLLRKWVSKPVKDLLKGTRRVADGDMEHVIPVGEAEMGALALAFNRMQGKLLSSQRQLVLAEKLASIGKLAASVAHEINNPLTGILTFAEDLADESGPDDPRLPDYKVIQREAMRCREIVRELLDFSRQDDPCLRPIDVNDVLSHTVRFISKQAIFRNVEIIADLQGDLPPVVGDPIQFEQVVLGLMVNATEAMPDGGRIFIKSVSVPERKCVEISILDTGCGISEENLQRIFEPFFSTKGEKSIGIGLAVSFNIINQHGGRLEVDSKLGEGATFRIIMPLDNAELIAGNMPD